MTDIVVSLPDNMGTIAFPEGTPTKVIEREAANAYMRLRGEAKGKADARDYDAGLSQAVGGGVLQGLGDEATAYVRSRFPKFSNWMMSGPAIKRHESIGGSPEPQTVSDAPTAEQRYEEELARERAKRKAFSEANPVSSAGGTIFGAIAPTVPLAMAGVPIAPRMGTSLVGNLAKGALTGAGYGGLYGFNEGEGGFDERLKSAGEGAAAGAALAPPFMLAGRGGAALLNWAKTTAPGQAVLRGVDKVAGTLDRIGSVKPKSASAAAAPDSYVPGDNAATYAADQIRATVPSAEQALKQRAAENIATAVERGKMTPAQAQAELDKLGTGATLADVNKSLFRKARMTNTLPGETENLAEDVLTRRAATYNPRLRSTIEGQNPPPEDFFFRGEMPGTGNIFEQTAREVGRRVYGEMNEAGLKQSKEMLQIMQNPKVEAAIDRVLASLKEARVGTDRPPESLVETMHMIKREIQNIGLDATGRPSSTAFQWQQTANDFVDALKKANPKLAEADTAYAKAKSLPDYYDVGLGVFDKGTKAQSGINKTGAAVENLMKTAEVMQANATQFGAINAGRAMTGGIDADAVALARKITQSDDVRRKIEATFGERAKDIIAAAETVLRFEKTRRGILGGSQTADKAAETVGEGLEALSVRATPGSGIVPRFFETASDVVRRIAAPNEPVRNQMGRMLLNTDPGANAITLSLVEDILRKRAAQRQGGAVWGGLTGGYGSETVR